MLRSIFSLIQKILDSDKKYNNTKSRRVIYCFTEENENSVKMNFEVDSKQRKVKKMLRSEQTSKGIDSNGRTFSIDTSHGDVVTCKHHSNINIVLKTSKDQLNRVVFSNTQEEHHKNNTNGGDVDLDIQPKVDDLIVDFPRKSVQYSLKGAVQLGNLLEQIQKMRTGLEKLHEIALQFNCSENLNEDFNCLINNVRPHLEQHSSDKSDVKEKVELLSSKILD
ncbi:hypothetical protein ABEB36_007191 [Hypothenemus hampei]|uniref:Uncharacterized protein n=1 Tax=Hypothenemus hampei TaxID=57062 RepID=A0ABD1ET68_HYPHA